MQIAKPLHQVQVSCLGPWNAAVGELELDTVASQGQLKADYDEMESIIRASTVFKDFQVVCW